MWKRKLSTANWLKFNLYHTKNLAFRLDFVREASIKVSRLSVFASHWHISFWSLAKRWYKLYTIKQRPRMWWQRKTIFLYKSHHYFDEPLKNERMMKITKIVFSVDQHFLLLVSVLLRCTFACANNFRWSSTQKPNQGHCCPIYPQIHTHIVQCIAVYVIQARAWSFEPWTKRSMAGRKHERKIANEWIMFCSALSPSYWCYTFFCRLVFFFQWLFIQLLSSSFRLYPIPIYPRFD